MRGIKIPLHDFALKMQGGAYARGGAYLRDTTVYDEKRNHLAPERAEMSLFIIL